MLGVCLGREVTQVSAHPALSAHGLPSLTYPGWIQVGVSHRCLAKPGSMEVDVSTTTLLTKP